MVRLSLVLFPADSDQVHKLPKNRPIDRIDVNRLRKNKVFANSGGVCIYNTACHSTEILVTIGHWHSVGECSLVTCNAGCASTTTACVPAEP